MAARNSPESFGWVSRTLHWAMAVAILLMLALGTYIAGMEPSLSTLWLYGLHKSTGLTLLALALARLAWHRLSPPPPILAEGVPQWQVRAASAVHRTLYALMLAVPLTGWAASSATGIDTVVFGRFVAPRIAPVSEGWEQAFFALHEALTTVLILVVLLHAAGALHRAVLRRDGTLRRMTLG